MGAVNHSDLLAEPLIAQHVTVPSRYRVQRSDCDRKHQRGRDQLQNPHCDAWLERHEEQWQGNETIQYTGNTVQDLYFIYKTIAAAIVVAVFS